MNQNIKEAYKQRICRAVVISNYLNNPDVTLDADHLRINEDILMEAMARFMNAVNIYINEFYRIGTSNAAEAGKLKKEILNTINYVAGATMSFGKGLTLDKYSYILKKILEDIEPEAIIE